MNFTASFSRPKPRLHPPRVLLHRRFRSYFTPSRTTVSLFLRRFYDLLLPFASRGVSSATSFLLEPGTSFFCPFFSLFLSPSTRASRISTCGVARNRSGDHGSSLSSDSGLRQPEHGRSVTLLMSLELSFHRPFRLASTSLYVMSIVLRVMVLIVEGRITGRPVHHAGRLSVHHVTHRRVRTVRPARSCRQWWKHSSIALVDHWLNNSTPRVYKPVVHLKNRQPRVLCQLFFLVFRRIWMREMLKEPRPEDVRRNFRKDTPFLLVFLARRIVVFLSRPLAATDTRVTRVTCGTAEEDGGIKDTTTRVARRTLRVRRRTPFSTRTPFAHCIRIR